MMGQTLSEPVKNKETSVATNELYYVASSSMQGWRVTMEDSHTILLEAPDDKSCAFFGVFDGHGGASVANFASMHLHKCILNNPTYKGGNIKLGIQEGFISLDSMMRQDARLREEMAGSTAVTVLIKGQNVYCGNAGDSRAIAFVGDEAIDLSNDHKPTMPTEFDRITKAGCYVEFNRVNGNLAVSRALGDFMFKTNVRRPAAEQAVTCFPDVRELKIDGKWKFIVLACDGIWDVMTTEEVGSYVKIRIDGGMRPEDILEDLLEACIAPDGHMGGIGSDNMTAILIILMNNIKDEYRNILRSHNYSKEATARLTREDLDEYTDGVDLK